jgi:hypothetical protein
MSPGKNDLRTFWGQSSTALWITLLLLLMLGLGIRLYDLTDPPLDFHSTRQLFSAIIARGMYYQDLEDVPTWKRELAVETWKDKPSIEPSIFESLVALTYKLMGREIIWIPRIYSSIFWLIGGIGLYTLARELTSIDGGIIALIFYLFVPFGVIASRSFQPDPLMVMWIILAWWSYYRWHQRRSWRAAITAGLFAGIAILVKSVAVFLLFGGMVVLPLISRGIKAAIKNPQLWTIACLSLLPVLTYTLYGLYALGLSSQFDGRFFPELLKDPAHYIRWGNEVISIVGFSGLFVGLLGINLFREPYQRGFVAGIWGGYLLYGLFFPYHFLTHNYYHLPLIPLVAISLAPVAKGLFNYVATLNLGWFPRFGIIGIIVLGIAVQMWNTRVELARNDYRHEPAYWQTLGDRVGQGHQVIALTQDYGDRLLYYGWLKTHNWSETKQIAYSELRSGKAFDFGTRFADQTQGMEYFLVTRIKELERQPELRELLYERYPLIDQGEGYLLFDLTQPLP